MEMTYPYRDQMSTIDLLNERYQKEEIVHSRAIARAQLKYLVDRWKEAKKYKKEVGHFELQISQQVVNIRGFDPDFSFELWLADNYNRRV